MKRIKKIFKGRINRKDFLIGMAILGIFSDVVLPLFSSALFKVGSYLMSQKNAFLFASSVPLLFFLGTLIIFSALCVRRSHDFGDTGFSLNFLYFTVLGLGVCLPFLPKYLLSIFSFILLTFVVFFLVIFIYTLFKKGEAKENKFGELPSSNMESWKILFN